MTTKINKDKLSRLEARMGRIITQRVLLRLFIYIKNTSKASLNWLYNEVKQM